MRHLLPGLLLALAACSADPVLLPDAGPCNGSCGAGTVCQAGACVSVDSGTVDVGSGMDVQTGGDVVDVFVATDPAPDQGVDVGAVDVPPDAVDAGTCPNGRTATCDGRTVSLVNGEVDGGLNFHCGRCGNTCSAGEFCVSCRCER